MADDESPFPDLGLIKPGAGTQKSIRLSTDAVPEKSRLEYWRTICKEFFTSFEFQDYNLNGFNAEFVLSSIGSLNIGQYRGAPHTMISTPSRSKSGGNDDFVIILESERRTFNFDHSGKQRSGRGGITLLDNARSFKGAHPDGLDIINFFVPRAELERALGPLRLAAGLSIDADQASYRIIASYLRSLVDYGGALDEVRSARMSSIAVELIASGFAERMEQSPTRSLSGAAMLCRAQAYIANHLGQTGLNLQEVAAALQVSVRYLHQITAQEGMSLVDWMWERRLLSAREKLADPTYRAVSVATVAHQCGFADQAHFSRRFKERFGMPPAEFKIFSVASSK